MADEQLLIWLKRKEIEALSRKPQNAEDDKMRYHYFSGKAEGFANVWEHLLTNGGGQLHPMRYNELNDKYSRLAAEEQPK